MKELFSQGPIEVKRARPADGPFVFQLIDHNRDRLATVFPWVLLIREAEDQKRFYKEAQQLWKTKKGFHFVILYDHKHVGALSVHSIDWQQKEAQFGYWLDQDFEGKGIVAASIRMVEENLKSLGFERLVIRAHNFNARSRKVAESLGYRLDPSFVSEDQTQTFVRDL